ncbi:MAG TPA: hypothetical protein VIO58_06270 [Candidatus Methanoperedens sp.]
MNYLTKIPDCHKEPHFAALPGLIGSGRTVLIGGGRLVMCVWRRGEGASVLVDMQN